MNFKVIFDINNGKIPLFRRNECFQGYIVPLVLADHAVLNDGFNRIPFLKYKKHFAEQQEQLDTALTELAYFDPYYFLQQEEQRIGYLITDNPAKIIDTKYSGLSQFEETTGPGIVYGYSMYKYDLQNKLINLKLNYNSYYLLPNYYYEFNKNGFKLLKEEYEILNVKGVGKGFMANAHYLFNNLPELFQRHSKYAIVLNSEKNDFHDSLTYYKKNFRVKNKWRSRIIKVYREN